MPTQVKSGEWGVFIGKPLVEFLPDGRDAKLIADLIYIDRRNQAWFARAGEQVNGASIPKPLWSIIGGPFEGKYRDPSIMHDAACVAREKPWEDVHLMFYEACRCSGVDEYKSKLLYAGVYHFGPRWRAKAILMHGEDGWGMGTGSAPPPIWNDPVDVNIPIPDGAIQKLEEFVRTKNPSLDDIRGFESKDVSGPS